MKTGPDDLAFPEVVKRGKGVFDFHHGLTKREYITIEAMKGLLANPKLGWKDDEIIADLAITQADAQIAALNKEESE